MCIDVKLPVETNHKYEQVAPNAKKPCIHVYIHVFGRELLVDSFLDR